MNEVIKRAKHLTTQIESILICARGTTQHIILQKTKINIEEVIKTAIGNICIDLSSKPHSIEIVNESSNIECLADQLYIENAIKNLIENALKYSNDGVIRQAHGGKIRLRSRENEGSTFTFYISK